MEVIFWFISITFNKQLKDSQINKLNKVFESQSHNYMQHADRSICNGLYNLDNIQKVT